MTTHELKVWPAYYRAIVRGEKRFEARKDDRGFQVGDVLSLREWDPDRNDGTRYGVFTGRELRRTVTYILRGPNFGVEAGFVVMSIESEDDSALRERAEKAECALDEIEETVRDLENGIRVDASLAGRIEQLVGEATGRAEKAEALAYIDPEHRFTTWRERCEETGMDLRAAQARLARYEAPGPALLVAEHAGDCYAAEQDMDGHEVEAGDCDCGFDLVQTAYREQHARCMAVVERLMREIDEDPRASHLGLYAGGVRMALAALTGEAEK